MTTLNPTRRPLGAASRSTAVAVAALALACGCAPLGETGDSASLTQARERYVGCVSVEAEKDTGSPAGAEDIAVAAHARCWTSWDAYREAANTTFAGQARTREEKQLAHDKADAHLRQLERETRRGVMDRIVERTLTKRP